MTTEDLGVTDAEIARIINSDDPEKEMGNIREGLLEDIKKKIIADQPDVSKRLLTEILLNPDNMAEGMSIGRTTIGCFFTLINNGGGIFAPLDDEKLLDTYYALEELCKAQGLID